MINNGIYKKLAKLCPGDKFPTQQEILDHAHIPGIGQWFLDHETTQKWLDGDGNRVLWLSGPSGSGKTFLSSSLVNRFYRNNGGTAIGVFYFDRNDPQHNLADYDLAFRSITRQLVSQTAICGDIWRSIMNDEEIGVEDLAGTSDILEKIAGVFRKMIVVLDGVDTTNENTGLVETLDLLLNDRNIPSLRILMTCQNGPPDVFETFNPLEIYARTPNSDLSLYILKYMDESPPNPEVPNESHDEPISYQRFMRISNGLFLPLLPKWFSYIPAQPNKVFFDLVDSRWADTEKAFCEALVNDFQSSQRSHPILCLLYHIVKCDEMGYIFTVPMALEALDSWGMRNPDGTQFTMDDFLGFCEDVAFLNIMSPAMILRSPLLMDHLRNAVFGEEYHVRQAVASIGYLSKLEFANGACKSSQELKQRFQAHPYLWFAAKRNLPKFLPPSFESEFFTFAASQGNIESYLQAREAWPYLDDETYDECERDTERWNCYTRGTTALGLAVTLGNEGILRKFIDQGADLEARDGDLNTALHVAAFNEGESHMLKILLQAGSNVAVVNEDGLTPLDIAIVHGRLESVELLIQFGADIDRFDKEDLRQCVEERPDIAEFLVALGVKMPEADEDESMDD